MTSHSLTFVDTLIEKVAAAQKIYAKYSQEQVDAIFKEVALVANQNRLKLAEMAYNEAKMGNIEDKIIKNHYSSEVIYHAYKDMKTCGIVERNKEGGYAIYAEPLGVLAGIVPCTNPTSTTIFKILLALKTRNGIVFSPHPRTVECTAYTVDLLLKAAVKAGAPNDIVGCIQPVSIEACNYLMKHPLIAQIIATGAGGLVKAAYSSGKPCIGGGAGNTPAIIDETADVSMAVNSILQSKTFDNGMICASEQSAITVRAVAPRVKEEFLKRGAHFLSCETDKKKLSDFIFTDKGALNPAAVGKCATELAEAAGLQGVPEGTRVLVVPIKSIGNEEPFSKEKLCPVLGFLEQDDFNTALDSAQKLIEFGGMGHTSCLYTDLKGPNKEKRVAMYEEKMSTGRTLICMPTSHGGIGRIFNPHQIPSMSLGCGSWGGNSSAEGLQPKQLLNYKQVAERICPTSTYITPPAQKFGSGITSEAFQELHNLQNVQSVAIITNKECATGYGQKVLNHIKQILQDRKFKTHVYEQITHPLRVETITEAAKAISQLKVDMIVAVGDATSLEASKVIRCLVEEPEQDLEALSSEFMSMATKIETFKRTGKVSLVLIPAVSGTGAEVTQFATAYNDEKVFNFCDMALLPELAIIDYALVAQFPSNLVPLYSFETLTAALEGYVALYGTDLTRAQAYEAFEIVAKNIVSAYNNPNQQTAREFLHRAAGLVGAAIANGFPGLCEAMSHYLIKKYKFHRGLAKMFLISQIVRYNAEEAPTKIGTSPAYERPKALEQYAEMTHRMGISDARVSNLESVNKLINFIQDLKKQLNLPTSLKAYGVDEADYMNSLDSLSLNAFADQYTATNPRYPMISEIKHLYKDAYYGDIRSYRYDESYQYNKQ